MEPRKINTDPLNFEMIKRICFIKMILYDEKVILMVLKINLRNNYLFQWCECVVRWVETTSVEYDSTKYLV